MAYSKKKMTKKPAVKKTRGKSNFKPCRSCKAPSACKRAGKCKNKSGY